MYYHIFSYNYNGNEYNACNNEYSNIIRYEKGEQYSINIDPNEHGKYLEAGINRWIAIVLGVIGVAFIIGGIYYLISGE